MPHWRQVGATYFVTFRLADSLPRSKLDELASMKADWEQKHPEPRSQEALDELARFVFERVEHWLDQGLGSCLLRDPQLAQMVVKALHHFDNDRYELGCHVVMANHVHAILRPLQPEIHPLENILGSWKSFTSRHINAVIKTDKAQWQEESYDRIIRDEEHLWRTIQYVGRNPEKAGLPRESCELWIKPEWEALGWMFEWRRTATP
jgi:REP element-mobilizing transposase RayT